MEQLNAGQVFTNEDTSCDLLYVRIKAKTYFRGTSLENFHMPVFINEIHKIKMLLLILFN